MLVYGLNMHPSMILSSGSVSPGTAAVAPSEGKSAEALTRKIAGNLSGTGIKRLDESAFAFTVISENTPVRCILRAGDEFFLVEAMAGDPAIAEPVFQSLKLEVH